MADRDPCLRATRIIAVATLVSLLVCAALIELIKIQLAPFRGFARLPQESLRVLRGALRARAPGRGGSDPDPASRARGGGAGSPAARGTAQTASVVTFALCESVGMFGVVPLVTSGSSADFCFFIVRSLGLFARYFPRRGQWEDWARQVGR